MKTKQNLIGLALLAVGMFLPQLTNAQNLKIQNSNIKISGTSTMHDWDMSAKATTFTGVVNGNTITNVKFVVPAKNLKSTKGSMMDSKAAKALKDADITFAANTINIGKSNVTGQLTIAGVTKNITLPVNVVKKGDVYVITGDEGIKMSDYKMDRPGMIGMKAGDDVKVNVTIEAK